ncbi:DNA invertase [Paracoccus siganidrum]|uniref:DNA invertase n=1 Tax=Paracoccus siganidrum TaxID=1276757 RepID=A0A419AB64_9RHOB|nr:DNA invertase [Paracoccus siganidrum]RJL20599.1 DNA invertase [Paracoccus siganidrum]RMC38344.1 DNA invertase [Paracoccus siganidrum]
MTRYVIYMRVGYEDQGRPEASLAAQRRDIDFFLDHYATAPPAVTARFRDQLVPEGQPLLGLQAALSDCRKQSAVLLVARLDRLPFAQFGYAPFFADPVVGLRVAALPHATKTELSIHARMLAQEQSFHARQALARLENRGAERNRKPLAPCGTASDQVARIVLPMRQGGATLRDIASALNRAGLTTASGTAWRPTQVSRLLHMLG